MDYKEAAETLDREARAFGLFTKCDFVPQSASRNAKEKNPTLNWRVYVFRRVGDENRIVLACDYSQGIAHLPGYSKEPHGYWNTIEGRNRIERAVETGRDGRTGGLGIYTSEIPAPPLADVLSSLLLDASAIDEGSFEDWAASLGYDPDSRKAEAIWKACVETGLKLRSALGDEILRRFSELARNL